MGEQFTIIEYPLIIICPLHADLVICYILLRPRHVYRAPFTIYRFGFDLGLAEPWLHASILFTTRSA
jgi:hypothetical protein